MRKNLKNGRVFSSVYSIFAILLIVSCSSPDLSKELIEIPNKSIVLLEGSFDQYQIDKIQTVNKDLHFYMRDNLSSNLVHIIHHPETNNTETKEINYLNLESDNSQSSHIIQDKYLITFNAKDLSIKKLNLNTGQEIKGNSTVESFLKDNCYPMLNPFDLHYGKIDSNLIFYCSWMDSPELKDKNSVASTFRKAPFGVANHTTNRVDYFGSFPEHLRNGIFFNDALIYCAPNINSPNENWFSFEMSDSVWCYSGKELKEKLYIPFSKKEKQEPFNLEKKLDKKYLWNYLKQRQSYSWIYFDHKNNNLIRYTSKGDSNAYLILFDLDQKTVIGEFPVDIKTHDFQTLTPYENGFYVRRWFPKDSLTLDYFEWPAEHL